MNEAIHVLIEEVNSREISAYQEETEGESSTLHIEEKTEVIYNLIINPIS